MFPHWSLILAILRVAIFCIEVPERELREERYAIEAAAEVAYCFELNSLSGTEVLKMATEELPESNDRWGISFYVFYLLRLLFHLIMETFFPVFSVSFFTVHGNPVSSTTFVYFLNHKRTNFLLRRFVPDLNE